MDYKELGNTEINVSKVCLGTMTFGDQNTQEDAIQQLDYALDNGINFVDTAEMYPVPPKAETFTRTETMIGNWLQASKKRDHIILASKVAGPRRDIDWIRNGPKSLDRENIREAVHGSLKRLQTDYLDLYQIHWPERNVPMFGQYQFEPVDEFDRVGNEIEWVSIHHQLETLAELIQEGKIRAIGVSNEQPWGMMEFVHLAEQYKLPRVATVQNCYNLITRGMEFGMTEILFREHVSLMAYSPLAFGHLTAKYIENPDAVGRANLFPNYASRYKKPAVTAAVKRYAELAREHDMTPTQMALSFVYHRWFVTSTVIGATTMQQLEENIKAFDTVLSNELMEEIEQIHLTMMNPAP